ncbi:glucose-6-phosphate exchanger SLC37A2-like [Ornithodoros turicata]|uniref:glucose-6-phosphate exchanger SLC37A2-like n=1 Tax=Ornithodoros turicata TaxID=34597 RepID=UPI0031392DA6
MLSAKASAPPGLRLVRYFCCKPGSPNVETYYRVFILSATFLAYTCYHMTRRPISVVKAVLHQDCRTAPPDTNIIVTLNNSKTWCDWAPFNGDNANTLLATLDSVYLFSYAVCMFISGFVAERVNLRYFLALGMLLSALTTHLFGLGYSLAIHSFAYYLVVQMLGGAFQSTGWPSVVTCVGNWFGKSKRGLIFGVWNAHTSVGNIVGAYVAGAFVEYNWGLSFVVPGAIFGAMAVLVVLFLPPYPEEVGCRPPRRSSTDSVLQASMSTTTGEMPGDTSCASEEDGTLDSEERSLLESRFKKESEKKAVTFFAALQIPGVVDFSLALFFAKLVSYTFLFWLPLYIHASTHFDSEQSAFLSSPFDYGGIVGGILAGHISDRSGASALTCVVFLVAAVPMMFIYQAYGTASLVSNVLLQLVVGLLINGPYALITTAVSAELGTHSSISGSSKALATVTAIIDGTGSLGAAVGPLFAGLLLGYGWNSVFYMMMMSDLLAVICLLRVTKREIERLRPGKAFCLN